MAATCAAVRRALATRGMAVAVSRPFHTKLAVALVCAVVRYAVSRYVLACPGVQLSTRCTLRKSRFVSPLYVASAEDCTRLPLSAAVLSRATL